MKKVPTVGTNHRPGLGSHDYHVTQKCILSAYRPKFPKKIKVFPLKEINLKCFLKLFGGGEGPKKILRGAPYQLRTRCTKRRLLIGSGSWYGPCTVPGQNGEI